MLEVSSIQKNNISYIKLKKEITINKMFSEINDVNGVAVATQAAEKRVRFSTTIRNCMQCRQQWEAYVRISVFVKALALEWKLTMNKP